MKPRVIPSDDETWARYKAMSAFERANLHMLFAVWVKAAWEATYPPKPEDQQEPKG